MAVLDDKKRLGSNDYVSFRVVEDRDEESQHLRVNDNGELEVPYIGLVPAAGKTCRELAYNIKSALEREYYYHATVILAVDKVSEKSRGRVYVYGSVKGQGPQEIPPDENYTVSKAIIRAGGFGDFANKRKVKLTRKSGQDFTVDLKRVIEEGRTDEDIVLQPDDQIYVPQRLINM
jgi:polysaccharide biosynthesis/export protein